MLNTNHIAAVLGHLQGVVGDLWTIQTQEYSRCLTASGESVSLEIMVTQVAERTLEEDTGCTEGFSDVENYEENAYKMTNSLKVFQVLKIVENLKFSCSFLVLAFHKLRKF